jgi:hypothetical protein
LQSDSFHKSGVRPGLLKALRALCELSPTQQLMSSTRDAAVENRGRIVLLTFVKDRRELEVPGDTYFFP